MLEAIRNVFATPDYTMPWLTTVAFLVSSAVVFLHCTHMLQLSSYQTPSYLRWLWRNARSFYSKKWFVIFLPLLGYLPYWWSWISAIGVFIVLLLINRPLKAKKPLVYTARVIRLLVIEGVLAILCGAVIGLFPSYRSLVLLWLAVAYLLIPFLSMLANWITMPLQRMINNGYIRDAKRKLAAMPQLQIIGITGSYGKTSMKFILKRLLSVRYETLMTPESYNTTLGVVRTIREQLTPMTDVFVCEMGARHVGDIKEICDLVKPQMGVLTSIGEQHLETFGTLENIIKTKFELVDALSGTAFLNLDSEPIRNRAKPPQCVTYALDTPADYRIEDLFASGKGSTFTVVTPTAERHTFTTTLLGRHAVLNILGAVAVAHNMGIALADLEEAISRLPAVPHRLALTQTSRFTLIDDAYNANPVGAKAALETLALFDGARILVTPGMVELGSKQAALNKAFGTQAAAVCHHVVLVGAVQTKPILEGLSEAGFQAVTVANTIEEALHIVETLPLQNKVVLLANDLPDNY